MSTKKLEADYLVIGAGAMGMAFVDEHYICIFNGCYYWLF